MADTILTNDQIARLLYRADVGRVQRLLQVADAYLRIASVAVSALKVEDKQKGGLL